MAQGRPIADLVDELLAADKELAGAPEWRQPNRETEQGRLHWPVLVKGEISDCYLAATVYPVDPELRFTICLVYRDRNIWRLDYEPTERVEFNRFIKGHPYSGLPIAGPHCHRWEDNRVYVSHASIPEEFPIRTPLGEEVRSWEKAFRYLLGETNIAQPREVPSWPPNERLL